MRVKPPELNDIEVRITLQGLNKTMLNPVKQAHPLTPDILLDIVAYLDLTKRYDLVFWGLLVVGFFTFFRKSNLMPDNVLNFDPRKQLTKAHVRFEQTLAVINVTWSKTIQYRQKILEVPLFSIDNSPLCPVRVLRALTQLPGKRGGLLFALERWGSLYLPCFPEKIAL